MHSLESAGGYMVVYPRAAALSTVTESLERKEDILSVALCLSVKRQVI